MYVSRIIESSVIGFFVVTLFSVCCESVYAAPYTCVDGKRLEVGRLSTPSLAVPKVNGKPLFDAELSFSPVAAAGYKVKLPSGFKLSELLRPLKKMISLLQLGCPAGYRLGTLLRVIPV